MRSGLTHYLSPKLEIRSFPEKGEFGVFANHYIQPGELLVVWGGDMVTGEELTRLSPREQMHTIQVEENIYQVPCREPEGGDFINHSCTPNAGLSSSVSLVAMRDIRPGEEICFDYAMSDGTPYDEFMCQCGTSFCRGQVTGDDWQRPDLQKRYAGYFSPYLQRRINQMQRLAKNGQNGVWWKRLVIPNRSGRFQL